MPESRELEGGDSSVFKGCLVSVKSSENKREKSVERKVPSKRKSVASPQSSTKKLVENNEIPKDVDSLIENQENQANCANSKDDNSDTISNTSETGSKESHQTDTSKYFFRVIVLLRTYNKDSVCDLQFC